jgi:hypothetical protein
MLVLSRVFGAGNGRVSEFCYFVTFAAPWTRVDDASGDQRMDHGH